MQTKPDYEHIDDIVGEGIRVAYHGDHYHLQVADVHGARQLEVSRHAAKHLVIGLLQDISQSDLDDVLRETGIANCIA